MRRLSPAKIQLLDDAINFSSGWVLDFTNATFESFFNYFGVDIYDEKYAYYGNSKGKRFRRFLEIDEPELIIKVLNELSKIIEDIEKREKIQKVISYIKNDNRDEEFIINQSNLLEDIEAIKENLYKLSPINQIIENRLDEITKAYQSESYFSVIILCGSILEGILLFAAQKNPKQFNISKKVPKSHNKPKNFQDWKLSEFIEVAYDIGYLDRVSYKYSHILREFRNYIHPFEALTNKHYTFDKKSAEISIKVLTKTFEDLEKYL